MPSITGDESIEEQAVRFSKPCAHCSSFIDVHIPEDEGVIPELTFLHEGETLSVLLKFSSIDEAVEKMSVILTRWQKELHPQASGRPPSTGVARE